MRDFLLIRSAEFSIEWRYLLDLERNFQPMTSLVKDRTPPLDLHARRGPTPVGTRWVSGRWTAAPATHGIRSSDQGNDMALSRESDFFPSQPVALRRSPA